MHEKKRCIEFEERKEDNRTPFICIFNHGLFVWSILWYIALQVHIRALLIT